MENPFEVIIQRLDKIERLIYELKKSNTITTNNENYSTEILNMNQAVDYLTLTKSAIYKFTSGRGIPHFKRGKKIYFKKSELDEWLTKNRISTNEELEQEAMNYISKRRRAK
jgi:excisionase family DNA binding protein